MTTRLPVFHVLLATSLDFPWEADLSARTVRDAYDLALERSGIDETAVTHLLVRQVTDDHDK